MPKLLPPETFSPVPEAQYLKLYDPARAKLVLKKIEEAQSFGVKLWTSKSGTENLGSANFTTTFYKLAEEKCPMNVRLLDGNKSF